MKTSNLFAAAILCAACAMPALAQDIAKTAPKNVKVLLENDQVRVLEVSLAPGEKTGMHSHPNHVVYFVAAGKAKQTSADGSSKEMNSKAGDVRWSDAVTHDTENVGKTKTNVLLVELKEPKK